MRSAPELMLLAAAATVSLSACSVSPESPTTGETVGEQDTRNAPLVSVIVPVLNDKQVRGEQAFQTYCASCHNDDAAGQEEVAPPLVHIIYEPNHHGDAAFVSAARNGARQHHWPFGDMPPVEAISDAEIADIIAYVRALQRANGIR